MGQMFNSSRFFVLSHIAEVKQSLYKKLIMLADVYCKPTAEMTIFCPAARSKISVCLFLMCILCVCSLMKAPWISPPVF